MYNSTSKKLNIVLLLVVLLSSFASMAQTTVPFSERKKIKVKGDVMFVGNHILNRIKTTNPTKTANDAMTDTGNNNDMTMEYIDIDGDPGTFSSSSANLLYPTATNSCYRVAYAGLYWASIYPFERSNNNSDFVPGTGPGDNVRHTDFNQAKIKLPSSSTYLNLTADQTIFDGFGYNNGSPNGQLASSFKDCPIVCYKDVTTLVQGLPTAEGTYTVANIRAAKGKRNGGCSAGWVLVVIYENVSPNTPSKFISIFDGYSGVQNNNTALININGFTTLPNPFQVNATFGVGALEGDLGNSGDGLSFKSLTPVAGPETALSNGKNPANNFFNSTITNNDQNILNRNPASTNTLGFDLDMLPINNPTVNGVKNTVIPNGTTGAQLKLSTNGDGYGAFLATFSVEIIEPNIFLTKRVLDAGLNDIAGQDVGMGDELTYEITYKNVGNDDAQNLVIRDVLPTNTVFLGLSNVNAPSWVTVDASVPGVIRFINTQNSKIVKNGTGGTTTIRFKVRVASSCNELTDHCSNLIQNQAYATYQGVDNVAVITDDPSVSSFTCGAIPGPTNSLIGVSNCVYERTEILCGPTITLTAGNNYASYSWEKIDPAGNIPMGNTQSIVVSTPGQYKVTTTSNTPPCIGIDELITVNLSSDLPANPLPAFADTTPICPNNGIVMSNIFLCGLNDQRILNVGNVAGTATWSKLNTGQACITTLPANCPQNGCPDSAWTTVGTGPSYTVNAKGEYRLVINNNGCQAVYYFNVTKNDADPQIAKKDILCGNQGEIKVINLGSGYEYRLINQTTGVQLVPAPSGSTPTYGSVSTFPIITTGTYTVEIRQIGVPNPCIFTLDNIGIQNATLGATVTSVDKTCETLTPASITIEPTGFAFVSPPQEYLYEISGPVALSSGGYVTTNPFTFNNNLAAGTYTVTVTSTSGCTATNTVTINDYSNPTATATVQQSITCVPGIIHIVPAGGKAPYSFVAYSKNGVVITPTPAFFSDGYYSVPVGEQGTYVFEVSDASGCKVYSNPVTIDSIEPVITTAFTNPNCSTGNTGTITVTATGTGITYDLLNAANTVIVPDNTSGNFGNLAAGSYTVNIKKAVDTITCTYPRIFNLVAPTAISGSASITTPYTCLNSGATITAANASGGTSPYQYSIDGITFGASQVFGPLGAGTYTVTVKDANGCIFTAPSITVTAPAPVTGFTTTGTAVTCPALTSNVTISAVTGGAAPFTYAITSPTASAVDNGTNATFSGLAPGVYTFTVTDSKGCTYNKNHTVTAPAPLSVAGVKVNDVRCYGSATGAATYTVSGVTTYNYTVTSTGTAITPATVTGYTSSTINLTALAAGDYTIEITNPTTNCKASATVTIANPTAALSVTNSPVQPTCTTTTGSVTVNATGGWGGNTYALAGPSPRAAQSSNNFTGLAAGNYIITVTDSNGCIQTSTFTLNAAVAPVLTVTGSDVCLPGTSITVAVTAGTGLAPFQYSLNGGAYANGTVANGTTYTNLAAGTYTITVRDANGCTNATTVTRTINPQLTASTSLTKGITCTAPTAAQIAVSINGGGAPYQYQVSYNGGAYSALTATGGATFTYNAAAAGTYQFQITDAAGCTVTTPIRTVAPKVDPEFTFGTTTDVLCNGSSTGALTINIDNTKGLAPYTISVTNTDTSTAYGTQTSGLPAGNYSVTVTDANGCTVTHVAYIDEPDPISYSYIKTDISCNNPGGISYGQIEVASGGGVTGGTPPFTYTVSNNFGDVLPVITNNPGTSSVFLVVNYGVYSINVTDANGCSVITNNIVIASPPDDLDIVVDTTADCINGGTVTVEVDAAVGSGTYKFAILTQSSLPFVGNVATDYKDADLGTPTIATFNNLIPGIVYTFVVWDTTTQCYFFKEASVPIPTNSTITATSIIPNNVTCFNEGDGNVSFTFEGYSPTTNLVKYEIFKSPSNLTTGIIDIIPTMGVSTTVNNIPGNLVPGDYIIVFTEIDGSVAGCSSATTSFKITQSASMLTLSAVVTKNDNCNTNAGIITATAQFGTAPYSYQLLPYTSIAPTEFTWAGQSSPVFNAEGGDYIVYVKDANDCIKPFSITLPTDISPEVTAVITPNTQCTTAEGSFSIDVTRTAGDAGGYTYSLNGGAFETQPDSFTYSDLTSGSYSVTIKDGNGCTYTIPVTDDVIIYAPLTVTAQPTVQPTCVDTDGSITAAGTGGSGNYEYELLGTVAVTSQASPTFNNLPHGSYTVRIHDTTTGCTEDVTVNLEDAIEILPATVTIDHEDVSCNAGTDGSISITLDTTVNTDIPYTYTVLGTSGSPLIQTTPLFENLPADTYDVTITSGKNCSITQSITIDQPSAVGVTASVTTQFTCATDNSVNTAIITAVGSGGTPNYTYSIDGINYTTDDTFEIANTGAAQVVTVYVKDDNGCTTNTTVNIAPLPELGTATAVLTTAIECDDNQGVITVTALGGSGDFTFKMEPSGTPVDTAAGDYDQTFTITEPGIYTFTITDDVTGCYTTVSAAEVMEYDVINVTATVSTPVVCFGSSTGSLTIDVQDYTGAYNYAVFNGAIPVTTGSGNTTTNPFTITGMPAGNLFVTVTAIGSPYCSANSNSITVASPAAALMPNAIMTANVTCTNDKGEITANATGGWGAYEYEFINTTTSTPVQAYAANNVISGLSAGDYTVNVRDASGCVASQTITLTVPPVITATATPSTTSLLCYGDTTATITVSAVSGGQGAGNYQYILNTYDATGTTIVSSTGEQSNPVFANLGAGIYSVTVIDGWSCDSFPVPTTPITITEPAPLVPTISLTKGLTCLTDAEITISSTGGTATPSYEYSSDNGNTYTPFTSGTVLTVGVGSYQYLVRDANGCSAELTNSVDVFAVPALNVNLTVSEVSCHNSANAQIAALASGGLGNYQYSLLNAANTIIAGPQPNNVFEGLGAGTYSVLVESDDCEITSSEVIITNPAELIAVPAITNVLCFGQPTGKIEFITSGPSTNTSGGTGNIQFAISPYLNQFFDEGIFENLSAGFYDIIVQDENGCFIFFDDLEITQPDQIQAEITVHSDEACLGSADGTVDVNIWGGNPPYAISTDDITYTTIAGTTYKIEHLPAGFTDIYVKDANGCSIFPAMTQEIKVGVDMNPEVTVVTNCVANAPSNTVTINITPSANATGTIEYSIDNTTWQSGNTFTVISTVDAAYTAYVKHTMPYAAPMVDLECIQQETFTITGHTALAATPAITQTIDCYGDTGEVTITTTAGAGTAPFEYSIGPAFTYGTSNVFSGLIAGTYNFKVRDAIGCEIDITGVVVNQPMAALTATATHTDEICINADNGTITVTPTDGTGPYQVSLNGGTYTTASLAPAVFTDLADGTYTIDVRDANGCTFAQFTETIAEGVDIQPSIVTTQVCDETTITVSVNPVIAAIDLTYALDGGTPQASNQFVITGLTSGSHNIIVSHSNGCDSAPLTFNVAPVIPILMGATSQTDVNCFGGSDGTATATATGGTAPLTYAIAPNVLPLVYGTYQATGAFTGLAAGDYIINVKDALGCELASSVITVGQPAAALTATATSTDEICINANNGTITVTPTDGTGPYQVSLNGGTFTTPPSAGPITISNLSDTTYTIDVRDANGCTYTLPAAITIAEGVDIQGDYQIFPTCTNNVIGNIVFPTVNPNIPASDFECALDGGIFEPADSTFYQDLSAGSHTITFRYLNGCTQNVTFTVPALIPISASIDSQTNVLCFGNITGDITVTATGGTGTLSYAISDQTPPVFGTYQSTGVFTGLAAGDYTISIMDDNVGCETQLTTTITEPTAALTATASSTNEICINANDGTITIVPSGGTAPYKTSLNGSAFASQLSYTGLADTTYTIDVRDANGCTYTLPAAITIAEGVDMQPVATVTPTCVSNTPDNDVTIAINPAVPASDVMYSIDGTNYQASNTFTGVSLAGGTYTAYAQNINGCIQTTTFTIIDRLPVTATAAVTADVLCYGTTTGEITVTASGGTTPLEYAISTATPPVFTTYQPSNVFAGLAAGDYTISVRDAIGCEVVTTVLTVTQPTAALTATASSTNEICINANDGTITIVPSGGTAPYETSLNGSVFASQLSYTGLADAAYTIDVRDANGCTYTLPAAITIAEGVDMQPVATVTPTCVSNTPDNDVTIAINPAVPASDVMYSIDGTNYQASNTFTGVSLAGGTYTAYAQNINGCIQTTTFTIIDRLPVTATAAVTADVLCYGTTTGEITVTASGGTTPLEYAISTATPPVFTTYQPSNVFAGLAAGDYTISVRDAIGCEVVTTVLTVTQPTAALTATASSTNEICINANDGTITIVPSGGTAPYKTSLNGSVFASQLSYTGLADTTYTIDVRDANGCTYTLPAAITIAEGVDMQPVATVTPTCVSNTPDNDVTIAINPAVPASDVMYSIDGTTYFASNTFTGVNLGGGTYTAYAQHVNGCIQTTTFTIIDRLPVTATAAVTADVLCYGTTTGEITVTATGGTTPLEYAISTATPPVFTTYQPSNVFAGLAAGDYTISVRDAIGCEVVTTVLTVTQPTAALTATASSTNEICINANDGTITIVPAGGTAPYETSLNGSAFASQLIYTGLADAAYTIDVRDANGCTYTLPAAITIAEGVDMQPVATVTPTCVSNTPDNDVTIAINPAIPASDVTYSIDGTTYFASNTFTGVNLGGGTYTAYAQHVNGCIQTTTFTIIDRLPVTATAAVTADVLCYGTTTGEITVTATGGTTPLEYAISTATPPVFTAYQPSNVFAGLAAGDYTISVRDAIGCEVITTVLTVTQPTAALTATASSTNEICINANDGTITIVPAGGTAPYETSLNGSAFASQLIYTGLADAAYTIDVRDANGCTYTLPAAITIAEGVDMQPVATVTPTCVSNTPDNDVTIAINPAIPASDVTYSIDGTTYFASNTFTGVNLGGGTYTAYAQHVNGCIQTTTFTIIDRLPVTATAAVTADVLCYGTTTGEITVTATGGTTPLEYAISTATPPVFTAYQPSNVFAGLAAGDYTISVRDAIGCEVITTVLTVTQPTAALTATASSTNEICINANDGTITIVPSGGTAPYETSLNGSAFASQLSYTGLADAAYTIDVRDANGCTYTLPAAITIAEGVDMQPVATVTPTCASNIPDNDVTIAINLAVAASDVTYSIDGTNYQASNTFTGVSLAGGTYTAYAQHVNGCIQATTFTIIDRLPVTATAAVTADVLCYGNTTGEITVTATGGTTPLEYAISSATPPVFTTYQPSNVFAGLAASDYTISVRDAIGCEVVTTVLTVTQPTAALAVTVSKTDEQCLNANDGTITIVATGGTAPYQSRIDSAAAFTAQMNYTALADGIYDVEVVDANGCSYTEQITIATGIQIQPSLLVTQQCTETTIEVSVNPSVVADVMYSLDGGASQSSNTFVIDGLDPAVTHTITVTYIQGCSETVDFNINPVVPIVMNAPTVTDVACHGKAVGAIQVNATGGTGPLQYAITWNIWPTPIYGPSNNFTDLLAGQYTLWVKDAMGCVVTTTVDVSEPAEALTLSAVATAESCINAHDGTITITPQGGVAPYSTAIISAVNFQQDVLTYSGLFGGTYDVYVRDANGCYAKTTVTIEKGVNLNPYIQTTLSCDNNNPVNTVTVLLNPVVQNMEYSLTGAPGSYTANNVFDLAPGSYTVYVKHINGCTAQLDFTVQDRPAVVATASSEDATCNGVNNGSITVTASGGTGTLKYGISPDFAMTQNPVFNNLLAGNYTIRVEDAYGCYTEVPVVVNEPTAIAVTVVDVLQEICVNDDNGAIEIDITGGTGPYATSLTPNGVFVEDQILFDNLDGGVTYTIYVKDTNGCTTTIDVPLDAPMDINATSQVVYNCNDNTVTIITDGNIDPEELTYTIEGPKGNNPPQTSNVFANLQDGTYTVEVLHISGCTDTTSFTIESTDELTLLLAESGLNQFKASTSGGKGPYTYTFEGNDMGTKNTFVYDHSGTYVVTVTDSRGCTTEASIEVKFIDIIIPDVITPGGDGQNDTWSPGNTQNYPNINTDIFDRYGRKVATLRQGQVWDGKYEGNELPTGDYWYLIKLGDADNREFVGHFTIYR